MMYIIGTTMVEKGSSKYCLGSKAIANQLRHWVLKEAVKQGKPQPEEVLDEETKVELPMLLIDLTILIHVHQNTDNLILPSPGHSSPVWGGSETARTSAGWISGDHLYPVLLVLFPFFLVINILNLICHSQTEIEQEEGEEAAGGNSPRVSTGVSILHLTGRNLLIKNSHF